MKENSKYKFIIKFTCLPKRNQNTELQNCASNLQWRNYNPEVKVSKKFQVLGAKCQVLRKVFITPNLPSSLF